ncbi:MAG: hypothetical protein K0S08_1421 [Gammaproteobacteria bacterium]|jgi:hypothetical protein|nr:hypothetical protein [Gammaproteobacteria bacterium]
MFTWLKRWKLNGLLKTLKKVQYAREQGDEKAKAREIQLLRQIAEFFSAQQYNKNFPQAKLQKFEYYRAGAGLNDPVAQYACALMCFDVGRYYEAWSHSEYSRPVHEHYMKEAFEQAFKFLDAAEANKSVEAKRYKGLAYIYGWGVAKDTNKGFQFILDSIDMANQWAQATKIIEKLNLNSPAFFQALTQYQSKNHKG